MVKKLSFILLSAIVLGTNLYSQKNSKRNKETISNQQIAEIIDTLSADRYEGRGFGAKGAEKAAVYIENYLKKCKIKPYFQQYRDSFDVGARVGYNIAGLIEGTDDKLKNEYIILSAHYDHIGKSSNVNDSVFNGANDNASGVSAVLNMANYINSHKLSKRSIIVVLFSGEEIGLTGSEHFADKIAFKSPEMYCGVNIDMIGSVLTDKPGRVYMSGFSRSNMGTVFNQYIGNDSIVNVDNSLYYDVFELSDNYPLYEKLNIPAHTLCTFDFKNYKHYHRVSDELKNVDIENTGIIVRNILNAFIQVINSKNKEITLTKQE